MAEQHPEFLAFNRGVISPYALGRVDLQRMRYSAEIQENWMPRVFGPMMLRPGWGYLGFGPAGPSISIPFIRSTSDAQLLEATNGLLRPTYNLAPIVRPAVATTITNPNFTGNITGWTTADQSGATSQYSATYALELTGTGANDAITYQAITVAAGDQNKIHGIRIVINAGPVWLRIGTVAAGNDDLQEETVLEAGTHSIGITPGAGTFYIYFFNRQARSCGVTSCNIEASGQLTLPAPWTTTDLPFLRWDQSADVMFFCDGVHQPGKIECRGHFSWSVAQFLPEDGPYRPVNFAPTTITPSAETGDITLAASSPVFEVGHVGTNFRLASVGQDVLAALAGVNQFTNTIRVTGIETGRAFTYTVSGTWSGKLFLQVSPDPNGGFTNVVSVQNTSGQGYTYQDGQANAILYYRIGFTSYSSGTADVELFYGGGSINGDVRITGFTDNETVSATVLSPLGGLTGTNTWYEGAWSTFRGFPSSVALHEDRLWWFGIGRGWGSVVDEYQSYDDTTIGDSGPISRSIGKGPVDWVNWGISLLRLLFATDGTLCSARSDSLDTPLTPTNFNIKFPVTQGWARLAPVNADDVAYAVHRNLLDVYELAFDTSNYIKLDYGGSKLTELCPEVCLPGIVKIVVQRQPDTRIHCILSDGTVAVMVGEKAENVTAWIKLKSTNGLVVDAVVLPSAGYEDTVIYTVERTINGVPTYYYERHALESECVGGTLNKQADSFVVYSGAATNVMTAIAPHLAGQQAIVWADGIDYSPGGNPETPQTTYLVAADGTVTMGAGVKVSNAVIGLPYSATFKGVKLAYAAQMGSALTMRKRVAEIGFVLADAHSQGLFYGGDLDHLNGLPSTEKGAAVPYDQIWTQYDNDFTPFDGDWDTDSRVWLAAYAPRPCRVVAMVLSLETEEG